MPSGAINILPKQLVTTEGIKRMYYIGDDNIMDQTGLNIERNASDYPDYTGSPVGGDLFIIPRSAIEEAYNNVNVNIVTTQLVNGNKFYVKNDYGDFRFGWLDSNNVDHAYFVLGYSGYNDFFYDIHFWFFTVPTVPNYYGVEMIMWNSDHSKFKTQNRVYSFLQGSRRYAISEWELLVNGAIPPEYSWNCLSGLNGNSGNYQLQLSLIDPEEIGDGHPQITTNDGSIFSLTAISQLRRICSNLQEGVETTVLYCGDNYATATRRTSEGIGTNIVNITLKFYFRSDILAFTAPEIAAWYEGGDVVSPEVYIALMYDYNEEVAEVNYITYNPANGVYKYNLTELQAEQQIKQLFIWLQDNGQYHEQGNPYDTGSEDNGGDPGTPRPQDTISDTPLPTISGLNMGIVTLYHPDDTEVAAISQFLWSDNVLDNFKKYFNNFADNILSLYILPYTPASLPTKTFKVGNMTSEITGVEYVTARYYDIDMGSVEVLPRWGSYLDYAPYTKIEIYLPYLGSQSLDVDEIMSPTKQDGTLPTGQGSKLKLTYRLDILTGVIVAKIFINNELRYQFEGKCGASIPLTGQTFASMVQGIVQAGAGLATTIATGGLTAPLSAAAAVAGTVNATKPSIERVGNISGDASMMSSNIPYITISSPSKPLLDTQEKYTGFPSYKAATLGNFSGFTQVIEAHVEGISCTEEERTLILKWLKEGIII